MAIKTKGRAAWRWHQMTSIMTSKIKSVEMAPRIKAVILTLAVWGWFPIGLADWIIRRCHSGGIS